MALNAPIILRSQLTSLARFLDTLAQGDIEIMAKMEAERLNDYFFAFSQQLKNALAHKPPELGDERLSVLAEPQSLKGLFNAMARRTRTLILSEMIVMPQSVIDSRYLHDNGKTAFVKTSDYNNRKFSAGFVQVPNDKGEGSVSAPLIGIDDGILKDIEGHRPQALLKALQAVATIGNHDMNHHLTSFSLNNAISAKHASLRPNDAAFLLPWDTTVSWGSAFLDKEKNKDYSDQHPLGYEMWLVMHHAGVRYVMGEEALAQSCDDFFAELKRIGDAIGREKGMPSAQETIDYLGTVLCFSLMRFLPLDHPFLEQAMIRLREIDGREEGPPLSTLAQGRYENLKKPMRPTESDYIFQDAIANFRRAGLDLAPKAGAPADYLGRKRFELLVMGTEFAHVFSPPAEGSELAQAQRRIDEMSLRMISATANSIAYHPADGLLKTALPDGTRVLAHYKNNVLQSVNDRPALIMQRPDGTTIKAWYDQGLCHREREPACIAQTPDGISIKNWYRHGDYFREDKKPQVVETRPNGLRVEAFVKDGEVRLQRQHFPNGATNTQLYGQDGKLRWERYLSHDKKIHIVQRYRNGERYSQISRERGFLSEQWRGAVRKLRALKKQLFQAPSL